MQSLTPAVSSPHNSRFGRVSIIGMPNAGKSSLLNRLINQPVSAVSSKVNTTRQQTVGCLSAAHVQLELVDTPGILPLSLFDAQRDRKQHSLHWEAWAAVYESDVIVLMVDPTKPSQRKNLLIAEQLATLKKGAEGVDKVVLVLSKCDLFWPHTQLQELAALLNAKCAFDVTLLVSAKQRRRVDKLKGYLLAHIGADAAVNARAAQRYSRRWRFEGHAKSAMTRQQQVLECVRAKLFQRTHQEVPYSVELAMQRFEEEPAELEGKLLAEVLVHVKTRSHQNLLNGSAGEHIRRWAARDLTQRFGKEVLLKLRAALT